MKTDSLFYELFRIAPRSLFELISLDLEGDYEFESITAKTTEKRFDGFMKRIDGAGPYVFLEIQGYDDPKIYWRLTREISTWYEQAEREFPFIGIVLFLDKEYKPKQCPVRFAKPHRLILMTLESCLKCLKDKSGVLTVLKPFGLSEQKELPNSVKQWTDEIQSTELPEYQKKRLIELLEYVIVQRFNKLTLKEIQAMIQLTPLEKTAAVQELMQISRKEGKKEGKKEALRETAKKMVRMKMDIKLIRHITGLSEAEIAALAL